MLDYALFLKKINYLQIINMVLQRRRSPKMYNEFTVR